MSTTFSADHSLSVTSSEPKASNMITAIGHAKLKMIAIEFSYCVTVMCPRAELHLASLFIEREIFNVDFTAGLVDGRGVP